MPRMKKLKEFVCVIAFMALFASCKKDKIEPGTSPASISEKPIAIAGADQLITVDSVLLSGANSYKNGGVITGYLWTRIYGPNSFNIKERTGAKTIVSELVQGVYGFELKVTDDKGLFAKDTVQITVTFSLTTICNNESRPLINAQLIPVGTLSKIRYGVAVASAENKIVFAGGFDETGTSSRVDILDVTSQTWSTAELSVGGFHIKAVTCGSKIILAGGEYEYGEPSKFIDIYDATTNTWSLDSLNEPRFDMTIGTVGNKVFFAGGTMRSLAGEYSPTVEIYDLAIKTWTTTSFTVGRANMATVTADNKLYFAGGLESFNDDALDRIDIYDNANNSWAVSHLSEPKVGLAAIAVGDKIYWAGGVNRGSSSCSVEIKDINTGTNSNAYLYKTGDLEVDKAITKDGKIIFRPRYYWEDKFDIYDIGNNSWYVGKLPLNISFRSESILSANNTIYIAGVLVNGVAFSNQVWKLEF